MRVIEAPAAVDAFRKVLDITRKYSYQKRTSVLRKDRSFKFLGSGGSRSTFALSPRYAIKFAHSRDGFVQNRHEIDNSKRWRGDHIAKVVVADKYDSWLVVERAETENTIQKTFDEKFAQIVKSNTGIPCVQTYDLYYAIQHVLFHHDKNRDDCNCRNYPNAKRLAAIHKDSPWLAALIGNLRSIFARNKKHGGHLDLHSGNWGMIDDKRLVIVDYGYIGR